MPYNLDFYAPLPPRRPAMFGMGQQDLNAMAQLMSQQDPKQRWLQRFQEEGPQANPDMAYFHYNANAMRDWLYPYLQSLGLAVGEQRRR
jgi:hypothetical protein